MRMHVTQRGDRHVVGGLHERKLGGRFDHPASANQGITRHDLVAVRRLAHPVDDDALRQVALSRMEGYNNDEIAEQLGCARRTVARRLELIRKIWLARVEVA